MHAQCLPERLLRMAYVLHFEHSFRSTLCRGRCFSEYHVHSVRSQGMSFSNLSSKRDPVTVFDPLCLHSPSLNSHIGARCKMSSDLSSRTLAFRRSWHGVRRTDSDDWYVLTILLPREVLAVLDYTEGPILLHMHPQAISQCGG